MELADGTRCGSLRVVNAIVLIGDPCIAEVPVNEIGDDLVDVRGTGSFSPDRLKHTADGAYAHLRGGLVRRLLSAQDHLSDGYRLDLVEGHRPYELQEQYFTTYRGQLERLDPSLTRERASGRRAGTWHLRTSHRTSVGPRSI